MTFTPRCPVCLRVGTRCICEDAEYAGLSPMAFLERELGAFTWGWTVLDDELFEGEYQRWKPS